MLSGILSVVLVTALITQSTYSQRKIMQGKPVESEKGYVVYLTKASKSPQKYDFWLCGGSIVTPWYIVTSAACVEDVEYMYAIAGYKKYVTYDALDTDTCTKEMKKKVVYTCVPKMYELDYAKIEVWSYIDIAVVKVESSYDFNDDKYKTLCSYLPKAIEVNYNPKYQLPGTDTLVMGWGHEEKWRKPSDTSDYNQKYLQYASTLIHDKNDCKKYFAEISGLDKVIDKYMICTLDKGNINDKGEQIILSKPIADGCTPRIDRLADGEVECEEDEVVIDETRRNNVLSRILERQKNRTRRQGICQNDHGGPLIAWVGSHQVLIGVASVFRVTPESHCAGPFLYTSTQCNGAFLDCVLNGDGDGPRRAICDQSPKEKGFDTIHRHISWRNHPAGPAENEVVKMRPQIPIRP